VVVGVVSVVGVVVSVVDGVVDGDIAGVDPVSICGAP
jgi:hypothetical protein